MDKTNFKNEFDRKFNINIRSSTDKSIINIFIDTMNKDFE